MKIILNQMEVLARYLHFCLSLARHPSLDSTRPKPSMGMCYIEGLQKRSSLSCSFNTPQRVWPPVRVGFLLVPLFTIPKMTPPLTRKRRALSCTERVAKTKKGGPPLREILICKPSIPCPCHRKWPRSSPRCTWQHTPCCNSCSGHVHQTLLGKCPPAQETKGLHLPSSSQNHLRASWKASEPSGVGGNYYASLPQATLLYLLGSPPANPPPGPG